MVCRSLVRPLLAEEELRGASVLETFVERTLQMPCRSLTDLVANKLEWLTSRRRSKTCDQQKIRSLPIRSYGAITRANY